MGLGEMSSCLRLEVSASSSTLSVSESSQLAISTRKSRTPRKRPNQSYNEAAALLSTACPAVFSAKHIAKPLWLWDPKPPCRGPRARVIDQDFDILGEEIQDSIMQLDWWCVDISPTFSKPLLLKLNHEAVLHAWSNRGSPFTVTQSHASLRPPLPPLRRKSKSKKISSLFKP